MTRCSVCQAAAGTTVNGQRIELRPYGRGGALVCFACGTADEATARTQFRGAIERAERAAGPDDVVVMGDEAGPRPHPRGGGRS